MKIDVLCRRQLNSEGSGGSRTRWFSTHFSDGVKSAILGSTFADYCDCWVSMGSQKGSILGPKGIFFRVWNSDDFSEQKGSHFGRGRRQWVGQWGKGFLNKEEI